MILAAGLSERMGGDVPKQLLPFGSTTVAARTVRNAEASRLDRVVVVTGYRAAEVAESVGGGRAEVVENSEYRTGNMSSFRVGAQALANCRSVIVLLADTPQITTAMIDRIIAEWDYRHPWAARCVYADGPAHPLLFSAAALREAAATQGAKGTWKFLDSSPPGRVHSIRFVMPAPIDVNTPPEYEQVLQGD